MTSRGGLGGALPQRPVIQAAQEFQNAQMRDWSQRYRTLVTPRPPDTGIPFDETWFKSFQTLRPDVAKAANMHMAYAKSLGLTRYYPYTFVIPEEQRYNIQRAVTDESGIAGMPVGLSPDGTESSVGMNFLGKEYWDFLAKELERQRAKEFDEFVIDNMDISTLVKKDYWKKRMPAYYQKVIRGGQMKLEKNFRLGRIMLEGPQSTDDWLFLYNNLVNPMQSGLDSGEWGVPAPPLPQDTQQTAQELPSTRSVAQNNVTDEMSYNTNNEIAREGNFPPLYYTPYMRGGEAGAL